MDFKLCILLELLILYILVYFLGFFNERLIFYKLFSEGPLALCKYGLMAVRGLKPYLRLLTTNVILNINT